jgi:hypothetical protein
LRCCEHLEAPDFGCVVSVFTALYLKRLLREYARALGALSNYCAKLRVEFEHAMLSS